MGCGTTTRSAAIDPVIAPSEKIPPRDPSASAAASTQPPVVAATNAGREMSRFFETRTQHTYYTLADSETIKRSLTISVGKASYSVLFPVGFNSIDPEKVLTTEKLQEIVETAEKDPQMSEYRAGIRTTVASLIKEPKNKAAVIRSYTDDGLYYIFNQYVRYGDYSGFRLFREYIFCLKGSLIELGKPVTSQTTVYRGLSLPKEAIAVWKTSVGGFGLFSAFTSTSLSKDAVVHFMRDRPQQQKVLMTIELSGERLPEFCDYLDKFAFVEDCGVFYPTNISKYSKYAAEEEVLFPPFYPFKVESVGEEEDLRGDPGAKICHIKLVVPTHVCLSSHKDYWDKFRNAEYKPTPEEYVKKSCELVKAGLSDDLMFCKHAIGDNKLLPQVLDSLTLPLRRFALEFELRICDEEFEHIVELLAKHSSDSLRHISFSGSRLGPKAMKALSQCIPLFTDLSSFQFAHSDLTSAEVAVLAPALKELKSLVVLNLCWNAIGPAGTGSLRGITALKTLNLVSCETGAPVLLPVLKQNRGLAALYLADNGIGPAGMAQLAPAISDLGFLRTLDLSVNDIGPAGAKALAAALATLRLLAALLLFGNEIGDVGAAVLAPAISGLSQLVELKIGKNHIGPEGTEALAESLRGLKALGVLWVNNNDLGSRGAELLADALREMKALVDFNISYNKIGDVGAKTLLPAMKELPMLSRPEIGNNQISAEVQKEIASHFNR